MTANRYLLNKSLTAMLALLSALLLAGCSGIGDVFGDEDEDVYAGTDSITGTVDRIDTASQRLYIDTRDAYRSGLRDQDTVVVRYDDRTRVQYQGNVYNPADLEIGDEVTVQVNEDNGVLWAQDIDVRYDASPDGADDDRYVRTVQGTVRYVDTRNGYVEVERAGGELLAIRYDDRTRVDYRGQSYAPQDLERGDEVEVDIRDTAGDMWANDITVLRSVSTVADADMSTTGEIHGTISYIDEQNRTIELEQAGLSHTFDRTAGNEELVLYYDEDTVVMFEGRAYSPANLERGDVISVDVREVGNSLLADEIEVVTDVRTTSIR